MTSFEKQLKAAIDCWELGDIQDEWMFAKLQDDVIGLLEPSEAFEKIPYVLALVENHKEDAATAIIETLLALARQSQTTEIPEGLEARRQHLSDQFALYGEYAKAKPGELFRYYRI